MRYAWLFLILYAGTAVSQAYRPPRLDDGHVDLQGVWNLSNLTPLERLRGFDRLLISAAEAATQPWTGENRFVRSAETILEFACHEGNYALEFVLRGARSSDAASGL